MKIQGDPQFPGIVLLIARADVATSIDFVVCTFDSKTTEKTEKALGYRSASTNRSLAVQTDETNAPANANMNIPGNRERQ